MRRSGSYRRYDPPSSASSRATSPGERRGMGGARYGGSVRSSAVQRPRWTRLRDQHAPVPGRTCDVAGRSSGENRIVVMALWCADSCAEKLRILKPNVPRMNPNVPAWARTQHVAGWVIDSAHRRRWREPVKP
jgi:ribosomal protein L39E